MCVRRTVLLVYVISRPLVSCNIRHTECACGFGASVRLCCVSTEFMKETHVRRLNSLTSIKVPVVLHKIILIASSRSSKWTFPNIWLLKGRNLLGHNTVQLRGSLHGVTANLFIVTSVCLYNDVINNTDYISSNGSMIIDPWIVTDVDGSGRYRHLSEDSEGKPRKISITIAGFQAMIWTQDLQTMKQACSHLTAAFDVSQNECSPEFSTHYSSSPF
jgi:hypothetical protein